MISLAEKDDKIHLSADQFIRALQGKVVLDKTGKQHKFLYKKIRIEETVYENTVVIDQRVVISEKIVIKEDEFLGEKLVFPHPILILGGYFQFRFRIEGGHFQSDFRIYGGVFQSDFRIYGGNFKSMFRIYRGVFLSEFSIYGGIFQSDFRISGGYFQSWFRIYGGDFQSEFRISGSVFQSEFIIYGGDFQSWFSIEGGTFQSWFRIEGGTFQYKFHIRGGYFRGSFHILGGQFQSGFQIDKGQFKSFLIKGGRFQRLFRIEGGDFQAFFQILGGQFHSIFRIDNGTFYVFQVLDGQFQGWFAIFGGQFQEKISIEDGVFTQGILVENNREKAIINHFETLITITSRLVIRKNSQIHLLTFKGGVANGGSVYINPIYLQKLEFEDFINEGKLEITGVRLRAIDLRKIKQNLSPKVNIKQVLSPKWITLESKSQINLSKSNLGNAVFKAVAFEEFGQVSIGDTKLNNISTVNKHFPLKAENLGNRADDAGKLQHDPAQMAEIYNQLYLAMQKQGNRLKEMEYYSQYLSWQRKATLQEKNWPALISLSLYQFSTNFGQSWVKGLGISLLIGLIFYFFYSISLGGVQVGFQYLTFDNIFFHGKHFFQFLLPTHKLDFIPHTQSRFLSSFLDIFSRIALGYMYYQTITAFRRFGRK
ncbi:hypothetical protein BKI52_02610 [marine bacterium AO1-C]|nr:hypothetical protein BKI52_02610 [marine bacterium AO1-C]